MKYSFVLFIIVFLLSCGSTSSVAPEFSDTKYHRVMLSSIQGDTADYVSSRLLKALSEQSQIEIIGPLQVQEMSAAAGIQAPRSNSSKADLMRVAKALEAQAFFIGRVRSGAMAISESTTIHSSIELDLIDTSSGELMVGHIEDDTSVSRMMLDSTSLSNVTVKTVEKYQKVFDKVAKH